MGRAHSGLCGRQGGAGLYRRQAVAERHDRLRNLDDSSAQVDDIEVLPAGPEPRSAHHNQSRRRNHRRRRNRTPQPQPQPQAKPTEVRTPSKPVITDIRTSDIVSIGGLHEPECGSSKVAVSARVTSPYRLAKVQMWRSDLATWSEMVSQGDNLYVSSQNFKAGNDFRVRAEDEFGDTTETDTLPSPCMRVGTVVNRLSGKCIDAKGSPAVDNEAPLQLWDCEDGWSPTQTDQRWGMTSDGFIQNALSGKCIDVKGSPAVDNGSPLQLWDCEFGSPVSTNRPEVGADSRRIHQESAIRQVHRCNELVGDRL